MKDLKEYITEGRHPKEEAAMYKRVKDHIARVIHFYKILVETGMVPRYEDRMGDVLKHDMDKLKPENIRRQALRFLSERSKEDDREITEVVREHIKSNPHHFEYWGKKEDDQFSQHVHCEKMPFAYMYEMIADWAATAEEHGNTVLSFYEGNAGKRFHFNSRQDKLIRKCAAVLDNHIDPAMKRTYSSVYIEPSTLK